MLGKSFNLFVRYLAKIPIGLDANLCYNSLMQLKLLIEQLQTLYESEMIHYDIMGEPEIVIDCFKRIATGKFEYAGFSGRIEIQRSSDGVYPILNGFVDD
jgi:hypothetical protein